MIEVVGYDTSADCVYDLDRWASQLSHGMLLETIAIAATRYGCRTRVTVPSRGDICPVVYQVRLQQDAVPEDPLVPAIQERTVQRRVMRPRPLTDTQREALERSAEPLRVRWFNSWSSRSRVAALCARTAEIRLTIPEAYAVHRSVIAWHAQTSEDRMPDASLGANALLLELMRRGMKSWKRLDRLNRLTGTFLPRLMLDYLPGTYCSAQLALVAPEPPEMLADRIGAGRAIQRLWLTATRLGLQMQPEFTPLVFARYAREGRRFSTSPHASERAERVSNELSRLIGEEVSNRTVWLARIGPQRRIAGRSLRLPLHKLIVMEPFPVPPASTDRA
jgi:hypothetical protein